MNRTGIVYNNPNFGGEIKQDKEPPQKFHAKAEHSNSVS